jgi:DNA (cytosine-5)-methyltransferase 1
MLTHGALFNGIAGFPLAAAWAGIPTRWTVEIDDFCNTISKKHFPDAIQYTDIHHATNLPYVDIISGGFPCQPYSVAGKQLGNADDRALWPQMLRIIREVKPAYVIGENVAGLINLALDDVLASLEAEGYTTETFIVPACGVGAPHRRDRLWIIAYANRCTNVRTPRQDAGTFEKERVQERHEIRELDQPDNVREFPPNTNDQRCEECQPAPKSEGTRWAGRFDPSEGIRKPDFRLTEPPVCSPNDGLPSGLVRNRNNQLKAFGNAIVPQVAYEFFKVIKSIHNHNQKK